MKNKRQEKKMRGRRKRGGECTSHTSVGLYNGRSMQRSSLSRKCALIFCFATESAFFDCVDVTHVLACKDRLMMK